MGRPAVSVKVKEEKNNSDDRNINVLSARERKPRMSIKRDDLHKHRKNIKEVMLCSNATPIRRNGDMGYMCCFCKEQYRDPANLKQHTLDSHKDIENAFFMNVTMEQFAVKLDITCLKCKICNQTLNTLEELLEHLKSPHQKTIYTSIKNHIIPFKFSNENLECCICMHSFSKFKVLLEHMNSHYRNYVCNVCGAGFTHGSSYKTHMTVHDTGSFKCDHCSQIFTTNAKKRLHEKSKHSVTKPAFHKCGYCNESFSEQRLKDIHLVSMHGLKLPTSKCQACDKVYKTRKLLNLHIKRDHLMERRHKCSECDMCFFKTSELKNHMLKHTGLRTFKCNVCCKCFGRACTLKEHMKIHDDVRRFKCEHCGQAFVQKCSWKGHMKSKHKEIV